MRAATCRGPHGLEHRAPFTALSRSSGKPQAQLNTAPSAVYRKGAWGCGQRRWGLGEERNSAANCAWGTSIEYHHIHNAASASTRGVISPPLGPGPSALGPRDN